MITVSIIMMTYGHENYIKQAIEGVLMQDCNFEVELIIADDNSPDNTENIVKEVVKKHPKKHWVKYTKHKVNKGMHPNFNWALRQVKGKYIAICEGDDYWTNPSKLQKQVNFMDTNPKYSMVCHNAKVIHVGLTKKPSNFSNRKISTTLSMKTIINEWTIPTASMLFRTNLATDLPDWFTKIYSGDYSLSLLLRHRGKIYFLKEFMSTYRLDKFGNSATAIYGEAPEFVSLQHIKLLNFFNKETNFAYDHLIHLKLQAIEKELKINRLKRIGFIKVFYVWPKRFIFRSFNIFIVGIRMLGNDEKYN